jgi:L-threonylcarbamoyladenylate synthase
MQIIKLDNQKLTENQIKKVINSLEKDKLIIYPTDTCYGLGADATSQKAIDKVRQYKGSKKGEPISVAVSDQSMAENFAEINETAQNLYENFLPGPITVISQGLHKVDPRVESEKGTLGLRIPDYQPILKLIKEFDRPITTTSAATPGGKTPYTIDDVLSQLNENKKSMIGVIIDAGELEYQPPSAVVDTTLNQLNVLRQGEIDFSQLKTQAIDTNADKETQALGKRLIKKNIDNLKDQAIIFALQGELGSGKTQIAKGIGQGLEISEIIKSPTYILVREYEYSLNNLSGIFYHIDAWRMESPQELKELGIKDNLKPGNVIAIEWIQKGKEILKELEKKEKVKVIYVELEYLSQTKRKIKFTD